MASTRPELPTPDESAHAFTHDSLTPHAAPADFATALRTLREQRGLTRKGLASQMGYDRTYVSHAENGNVRPGRMFASRADTVLVAGGQLLATYDAERSGQPARPIHRAERLQLLDTHNDVLAALWGVVDEASRVLVCAGSRSRDAAYLRLIEDRLAADPALAYYRILFGPPWHRELRDHLLRVLEIRDPGANDQGAGKSLFIALFDDPSCEPERFLCANEHRTVLPQLSLHGLSWYDTAFVVNDPAVASLWVARMQEAYRHGTPVETVQEVRALPILKGGRDDHAVSA